MRAGDGGLSALAFRRGPPALPRMLLPCALAGAQRLGLLWARGGPDARHGAAGGPSASACSELGVVGASAPCSAAPGGCCGCLSLIRTDDGFIKPGPQPRGQQVLVGPRPRVQPQPCPSRGFSGARAPAVPVASGRFPCRPEQGQSLVRVCICFNFDPNFSCWKKLSKEVSASRGVPEIS